MKLNKYFDPLLPLSADVCSVFLIAPVSTLSQTCHAASTDAAYAADTATAPGSDDVTPRELANFDTFLDSHPEISEQLRKDPSLVDNRQFVESHAALQQFLADHPGAREHSSQIRSVHA